MRRLGETRWWMVGAAVAALVAAGCEAGQDSASGAASDANAGGGGATGATGSSGTGVSADAGTSPMAASDVGSPGGTAGDVGSNAKDGGSTGSSGTTGGTGGTTGGDSGGTGGGGFSDAWVSVDAGSAGPPGGTTGGGQETGDWGGGQPPPDPGVPTDPPTGGPQPEADAGGPPVEVDAGGPPEPVCDTENEAVLYLSADDSNSMAGPVIARGLIRRGQKVYKAIRTYEFLNYYGFEYPGAAPGEVAIGAAMRATGDGAYTLQIGVQAGHVGPAERRPVNLTLSIDTSSSMGWGPSDNRAIDRVKESCHAIAGALRGGDVVSIATWADTGAVVLDSHAVTGPGDSVLLAACGALKADGVTNFHQGVEIAYALALKNQSPDRSNRVVLFSDGGANVSPTDTALIGQHAEDAEGEGVYLIGVGVGDPWNFNDALMDALTDAGKGAYVFLDTTSEAAAMWGERFVSNVEVAARDVQVRLTLPPTFQMIAFYGEEYSTDPAEVEPQHLASNDAMVFHQVVESCAPDALDTSAPLSVAVTWQDPVTYELRHTSLQTSIADLLAADGTMLLKGDAVVAYAEALKQLRTLTGSAAADLIAETIDSVDAAMVALGPDPDLTEIRELLVIYGTVLDGTFQGSGEAVPVVSKPLGEPCGGCEAGGTPEARSCAVGLCSADVLLEQSLDAPAGATEVAAATEHYGSGDNDLGPVEGTTVAVLATGPALGTQHSTWISQSPGSDPYSGEASPVYDTVEWRLRLKAPAGAGGFGISYVFLSEEYDDYVGTQYNDKFYVVIEAGSTNGGTPTVINYTRCRNPDAYFDFICSPGMQFCEPGERYCYVAINTAQSECCWLDGCPDGTATTDISGTGFECAPTAGQDGDSRGSSTGWLSTTWPIEPGEEFDLVFHVHDTADGIFDSAVILDRLLFFDAVVPGTIKLNLAQ